MSAPLSFVRPPRLRPGARLAAVSLSSGFVTEVMHRFEAGVRQAATLGLTLVPAPNALRGAEFVYCNPAARADDLHWALANPEIDGIVSIIGGDDSVRILPHLDLDLIRRHPKVFMGFSDTTVTLTQFLRAGVRSFYGPSVLTDLAEHGGLHPYVADGVRRALMEGGAYALTPAPEWTEQRQEWMDPSLQEVPRTFVPNSGWEWLQGETVARGHLIGGCAEVLDMFVGTPWWPEPHLWDGAVLCLETSEDVPPPAQVGYWLRNYGAQGILGRLSGLLLARPMRYTPDMTEALYAWVRRVLAEYGREDLPVVANMDFGHTSPQMVLPLGTPVEIDPGGRAVRLIESALE